jgi:DNA topoisomerase-2
MANKYEKMDHREHIYKKANMYIGSPEALPLETYVYEDEKFVKKTISYIGGLLKIIDEVISNSIDHITRQSTSKETDTKSVKVIKINVNKETGEISIFNDGDGIPIEKHEKHNLLIPEMIFGELLTSSNYKEDDEKIIVGQFGMGVKLTNIFSTEFEVETVDHRNKKFYQQKWSNNMIVKSKPTIKASTKAPYTKITFTPDYTRFGLKGLSDDMYTLIHKRVIDATAVTPVSVTIFFNDVKINIKDFEQYVNAYIGTNKTENPRVSESNDRWNVIVTPSEDSVFEQVSFINSTPIIRGGKHIDYITNQIIKGLTEIATKKKKLVKPNHIKDNIRVFVNCTIVNPDFDSQSKEFLTTPISKFGSKIDLSDAFMAKLYKTGLVDKAINLTEFHTEKKLTKTDGKKTSRIIVNKLDDANKAGTKESEKCTLILTEGDSAKTMAISGLSQIGRDYYGVFPLKGKVMNTKDANAEKINKNEEISNLKKILGLEHNKTYADLSRLRYGSVIIMTDQDHDGSHIKGLLFNLFQSLWPSLYKMDGFLKSMLTPIIKLTHSNNTVHSFYNLTDYENWNKTDEAKKSGWKIKYYKGLGTSSEKEAKEYFKNMKLVTYQYDDKSDEAIDKAFNKKRADDRKEWLMNYDKNIVLDYKKTDVSYDKFVDEELIHFSNRDIERSINNICDGLKESTRKILFACMKRKLYKDEIKVAQLAGNVSEVTSYHHGEASLQKAIIGMAQVYVGTNNINILMPNGQFGGRLLGGNDAASPRYIYTLISNLCRLIYREEDNTILTYKEDEGLSIEPEYFIPIIPMILVNGATGIGTGFSTNIPQYNPLDIIHKCKTICEKLSTEIGMIHDNDTLSKAMETIMKIEISLMTPWYLGFKGTIKSKEGGYITSGLYEFMDDNQVDIKELPIGSWTEDYKDYLEELVSNNKYIKDFQSHYSAKNVRFIIKLLPDYNKTNFEKDFKMTTNLGTTNMHLYSEDAAIKKYSTTTDIMKEWAVVRIMKYLERKNHQLKQLERDYKYISAKVRFILDVIDGKIKIMNVANSVIIERLEELEYPKDPEDGNSKYAYLLRLPISQLTKERKETLEKEALKIKEEIDILKAKKPQDIWFKELDDLEKQWILYKDSVDDDYKKDEETLMQHKKKSK